jgi:hypothetical protein
LVAIAGISLDYWLYFDVMKGFFKPSGSRAKASLNLEKVGRVVERGAPLPCS